MPHEDHRELNPEGFARQARALPELPGIREAFRAGRLSFAQVRAVIRIATPENEATLLMWAQHSTASQMEKFARLYRRYGENAAAMRQHRERAFTSWEEEDGMVSFRICLPAEQAAVVLKAIEAAKASLEGRDREDDVSAETFRCLWDGAAPDYGAMVELMDANSRPRPGRARVPGPQTP